MTLRRDLSIQLTSLYIAFVCVVLIASYSFMQFASQQLESDIIASDLSLANAIAQETFSASQSAMQAVQSLGENPDVTSMDINKMEIIFRDAISVRKDVNLIYRLDAKGIMQFHYPIGLESTVGQDFSFRDYFQEAITQTTPLFSLGRISPTTQQPVATAVMPIWSDQGDFQGVAAMNVKLQFLSDTLTNIATSNYSQENIQIAIIDRAGQIIAHSDTSYLLINAHNLFPSVAEDVLAGETGSLIVADRVGEDYIYSYMPIVDSGWGVVVMRPTAIAFNIIHLFRQGMVAVVTIFLISGLIFWVTLVRSLINPLERLARVSQDVWNEQIQSGDMTVALQQIPQRSDHLGILTSSLTQLHQGITSHLQELTTLLETSAAVVSTLDLSVVLTRILEQVEQLLDVQMSAIFVLDEEANLFRVEASRNFPAWYAEQVMIDPQDPNSAAMRAIRSSQPIQISDTETDPSYQHNRQRARIAGYRSLMVIKMNVQHSPPAVLLVGRTRPYTYSQREINLLLNFANHATMAMDNATLYARSDMNLQKQTHRLETLIQSLQDGLVLEDSDGNVIYSNQRIVDLVGLEPETIYQEPIGCLIDILIQDSVDSQDTRRKIKQLLKDKGIRHAKIEQKQETQSRHLEITLFDVENPKHKVFGRGWIISDITQSYVVERMRTILIASVSHELRTPLAGIKGYVSTLLADDVEWDQQSQREFLNIISRETDRLSKLVRDLLDMSKIESGVVRINRIMTDMNQMIEQIIQHSPAQLGERLQVVVPADFPMVNIDQQRVETILRNLIENAAKYSPDTSPILVEMSIHANELVVKVTDKGPGISHEQHERVFEQFYRVDNALTQKATGFGLGLAIARSFVLVQGGRIWLIPTDEGTCVAFAIPLNTPPVMDLEHKTDI